MMKIGVAVLALVLAGTASAGWRDLRVDGSSEEAFAKSLEAFQNKLSPARQYVFGEALKDIWIQGAKAAKAEQREYTDEDYYAQVDGLSYEEIVTFTDPTGDTAKDRYRTASLRPTYVGGGGSSGGPNWGSRPATGWGTNPSSNAQMQQQCGCASPMGPQGN
jgi:hypothetical protein